MKYTKYFTEDTMRRKYARVCDICETIIATEQYVIGKLKIKCCNKCHDILVNKLGEDCGL